MDKNKNIRSLAMLIHILAWVWVILHYSVNVPWFDDFDPFPDFLRSWNQAGTIQEGVKMLFQPNNEHRMVIGKLITLIYFKLTGTLNITFIHVAGALFTLGTFALIWSAFKRERINYWYFLPVPFLLFQFQYHLVFLWAICSMQHQTVVFFVILSMYLLSRNRFGWALLAGLCATFAMSNGIFVWASGAVILVLRSRYRQLGIWLLTAVVAVGYYFSGMSPQGNESSIDFLIQHPHLSFLGFFAFLGGLFDLLPEKDIVTRTILPIVMGMITMVWVVKWLWQFLQVWLNDTFGWKLKKIAQARTADNRSFQEFLLGIMVFLLANALIIGLLRPRFGFFVMVVSNYKMYPALFLIVAYLSWLTCSSQRLQAKIYKGSLVVAVLIWGISVYTYLPAIAERKKYLLTNAYNQEHHGFGLGHVPGSLTARYVDVLMKEMVSSGIYQYPQEGKELVAKIEALTQPVPGDLGVTYQELPGSIRVLDAASTLSYDSDTGNYAFLKQGAQVYLFKLVQHGYQGRNFFRQYDKGAVVEIPLSYLSSGTYQLGILKMNKGAGSGGILKEITIP